MCIRSSRAGRTGRSAAGNPPGARDAWKEALAILGEMRHPDAAEIARELRDLGA